MCKECPNDGCPACYQLHSTWSAAHSHRKFAISKLPSSKMKAQAGVCQISPAAFSSDSINSMFQASKFAASYGTTFHRCHSLAPPFPSPGPLRRLSGLVRSTSSRQIQRDTRSRIRSAARSLAMATAEHDKFKDLPAQHQDRHPGLEHELDPRPIYYPQHYRAAGKLEGKVALITGGDSGIGRSVACLFAAEGAQIAFTYKAGAGEEKDRDETVKAVSEITQNKSKAISIGVDLGFEEQCRHVVEEVVKQFGRIDILVNNASEQIVRSSVDEIPPEQVERTFRSNIFSQFFLTSHAVKHMKEGSSIINTTSVVAYKGNPILLDYTATKGAILSFTKGLSKQLVSKGIRVNAVAPGPIWTPLIAASFPADKIEKGKFGGSTPMGRPGQPYEVATSYVFLASQDASYISGQVIHVNGGDTVTS